MDISERKESFLESVMQTISDRKMAEKIYNTIVKFEDRIGKRIEEMSTDELARAMMASNVTRNTTSNTFLVYLYKYEKWCKDNGIEFLPDLSQVKYDHTAAIREKMVASPQDLQERMDRVFEKQELKTSHCLYRAFLWLLWSGIEDEDIVKVRTSDVDLAVPCVYVDGMPYKVPMESFQSLYVCATANSFHVVHPIHNNVSRPRVNGDQLLRGVASNTSKRYLTNRISDLSAKAGVTMNPNNIYRSGVFYRMYQWEKETGSLDLTQYVQDKAANNPRYYELDARTQNKIFHSIKSQVLKDYKNWKSALDIS